MISLVVPVRNEVDSIDRLLDSIAAQSLRPDEVLIVDGGSTDATVEYVRREIRRSRLAGLWLLEIGEASPGRGRNEGIRAATYDWVALTDAGTELDRHWLARLARVIDSDDTVDVVYGSFYPTQRSLFERLADVAYLSPQDQSAVGPVRTRSIASVLLRRSAWAAAGEFPDLRAAEDQIFMRRIDELGCKIAVAPEAVVRWHLQPTLATTFRRFRLYSAVNVAAGEQAKWHRGVARQYLLAGGGVVAMAALFDRRSAFVALGLGAAARSARTTWRRREGRSAAWAMNPARLLGVATILAVTDAAMFIGWFDAIRRRRAHR